jgi:MFS transporter, FSR family, fosmidomycin resistance protein
VLGFGKEIHDDFKEDSYIMIMTQEQSPSRLPIVILAIAHMVNDWYMNVISTALPLLVLAGMSVSRSAFLVSVFTLSSSLMQPVFGYLVDRHNQRWLVYAGTAWMALLLSLVGVVHHYGVLLAIVSLAGLGTAAFHPQASALVAKFSGKRKASWMAFFVAAGNVGWALAPLLLIPLFQHEGLGASKFLMIPGLLIALLIWYVMPQKARNSQRESSPVPLWAEIRPVLGSLFKILAVVSLRSWAYFSLIAFLPLYCKASGISLSTSSHLLFLMLFAGAIGGLVGGNIWDKVRHKSRINWVLVSSLMLSSPFFSLYLAHIAQPFALIFLGLAGAMLLASFGITVIMAQECVGRNAALASGLMLGFGVGIGGLGVSLTGMAVEHWGAVPVLQTIVWMPLAAGLLALRLRSSQR